MSPERFRGSAAFLLNAPKYDARINSAEAEGIAHHIIQSRSAPVIGNDIQVTGWIWVLIIDRRRDPLPV